MLKNRTTHLQITCALAMTVTLVIGSVAQAANRIDWRTGAMEAPTRTSAEIADVLSRKTSGAEGNHVVVQFSAPVDDALRVELADAGVRLLDYLGNNAYFAAVGSDGVDSAVLARAESLVDARTIEQTWKLHPILADREVPTWAVVSAAEPEGKDEPTIVGTYVLFHRDVPLASRGAGLAVKHGAVIRSHLESINGLVIELPLEKIPTLADEDGVMWIEPALPRMSEVNDSNRDRTGVDIVNEPPYGLDGSGVTVLVYDGGDARQTHVDFGGRLTVRDSSGTSDHSTHVACTVGGSGAASSGQYRGMAPGVTIESYGFDYDGSGIFLYSNPGDMEDDYDEAINTYGADISNNSIGTNTCWNGFPCSITGDYGVTAALIDAIVGGSLGDPFRIVWANGNERSCTGCPGEHDNGYHSTAPPACAKNHITVGALNSNDDSQTDFTSWGPTDDGRIKPDLAGPGSQSDGDYDVTSCSSSSDTAYTGKSGTSMAAPTVAGISALLLQDFRTQFPGEPDFRGSTLKALLTHTCEDLDTVGPDYRAGYGSVRAKAAVDFMRTGNFLEDEISQGEVYSMLVVVTAGEQLKITLAWDDYPGTANVNPALVNDLDLVVFDPSGGRHYPWTLDPANPSNAAVRTAADHVNNIEQVFVEAPQTGAWQVEVHGFNVPEGPQVFSVAASPMLVNCSTVGVVSMDSKKYACESVADIQVVDCDLNTDNGVIETIEVTIVSETEPAGEVVTLTETSAETAAFRGSIVMSETDAVGTLQITNGDTITVTYVDADDGFGNFDVVNEATGVVDCDPPNVYFVQTTDLEPRSAKVTFQTNEDTSSTLHYGTTCSALTETKVGYGHKSYHEYLLTGLEDNRTYFFSIDVVDVAGNSASDDNGGACYNFTTPDIPDFFTEEFDSDNDIEYVTLSFAPNGSFDHYQSCIETDVTSLPTDPSGGTTVTWDSSNDDDNYSTIALTGGVTLPFYGTDYDTFYVGTNGYVTFGSGDDEHLESLTNHFSKPRIAGLFDDLDPGEGGSVRWQQLADRVVVTWQNVPEYNTSNQNTFQIEMFFDGLIQLTRLAIAAEDGIVGISTGDGLSADFMESDLSEAGECVALGDCDADGDTDEDDLAVLWSCFSGPGGGVGEGCRCVNFDGDSDVDCKDWGELKNRWTSGDPPSFPPCATLTVNVHGARYLSVQPQVGPDPVALLVTGDSRDPAVACLSQYVQEDGTLDDSPVFLMPDGPAGWNTILVSGAEIGPGTRYSVQGDYGAPGAPILSPARSVTTWLWADIDHNLIVNIADIQILTLAFQGDTSHATMEATDQAGCTLDGVINMTDIQWAVLSFQGQDYWGVQCESPCP